MRSWTTPNGTTVRCICYGRSNVFLVSEKDRHVMVDTGTPPCYGAIQKALDAIAAEGGKLEALILTHAHFDHTANATKIITAFPMKLVAHRDDLSHFINGTSPDAQGTRPAIRFLTTILREPLSRMMRYSPLEIDLVVEDRFDLRPLGIDGYIIHTPGHTPGSVSVIVGEAIAIVGDAMFGVNKQSVFPPFALDVKTMVESWKALLDTNCTTFLPSHGSENSRDLLRQEYLKHAKILND